MARSRLGGGAAAALLVGGCSGAAPAPPPVPPVTLSTTDTAANVAPIVALFRQVCLEAAPDVPRMTAAVAASGWPVLETAPEGGVDPPAWRFAHGTLIWIPRPETMCVLTLDSQVSPTLAALAAALRPAVQRPGVEERSEGEDRIVWTWSAGGNRRMVLRIDVTRPDRGRTRGPGRQAVGLSLASERMDSPGAAQP